MARNYRFSTERLLVNHWHAFTHTEWPAQDLPAAVIQIMTEAVTAFLPPGWQGAYTKARATNWIDERDAEGVTLLVVDTTTHDAIGLVILFEAESAGHLRLGYMLKESAWGKGYASEIVRGFVGWCRQNDIISVTGGVEADNIASRRILEKSGFVLVPESSGQTEQLFRLDVERV